MFTCYLIKNTRELIDELMKVEDGCTILGKVLKWNSTLLCHLLNTSKNLVSMKAGLLSVLKEIIVFSSHARK